MAIMHVFRRQSMIHRLGALALLAWFGMVLMGSAHAMTAAAATVADAGQHSTHVHAHGASADHGATVATADMTCGMASGCHCANLCASFTAPHAMQLARIALPASGHAPIVPSVPTRVLPPLLHPPSV